MSHHVTCRACCSGQSVYPRTAARTCHASMCRRMPWNLLYVYAGPFKALVGTFASSMSSRHAPWDKVVRFVSERPPPPCCCRATRGITQHQLPLVGMHAHMKPRAHEGEGPCLWSCAASRQSNAPDGPARKFCPHMKRKSRIKA